MSRRTRAERSQKDYVRRTRFCVVFISALTIICIGFAGIALNSGRSCSFAEEAAVLLSSVQGTSTANTKTVSGAVDGTATIAPIELPSLAGMQIEDAEFLLDAVGLTVIRTSTPAGEETSGTVLSQSPEAGERVLPDTVVELWIADPDAVAEVSGALDFVVCIDPGHQAQANNEQEPIGPGAANTKDKVSSGATGVSTGQHEYEYALDLSFKIKERLENYGIVVIMTRTTNDVNISNAQRAQLANEADADLFIRVHADSNINAELTGISTLYPSGNDWAAPIEDESLKAAMFIQVEMVASAGAIDRGVIPRADLTGFNYATVPSVLVETGFLSSPTEDKLLATNEYQEKIADGIARGVLAYRSSLD